MGEHDPTRYADEVEQRWGDTDAYREYSRRSGYSKADWQRMNAEAEDHGQRLVEAFRAGYEWVKDARAANAARQEG